MERLTRDDKILLLRIAREAIAAKFDDRPVALPATTTPALQEPRGAFVTLHKAGALRGCIGNFVSSEPLYKTVAEMAVQAAFADPRFPPLSRTELPLVDLEISALTPLQEVDDPDRIEVGVHGIYLINGPYRGVLLPQVATEYGWDRYTFLDQTCVKAGMAPGCWRDPATKILIFSAEVFGEKELGLI